MMRNKAISFMLALFFGSMGGYSCHSPTHEGVLDGNVQKKPILPEGFVQSALSGVEGKATAFLTHGAYASYVSANTAKSGQSVSPKAAKRRPQVWQAILRQSQTMPLAALRPDSGQTCFTTLSLCGKRETVLCSTGMKTALALRQ